MSGARSKLSHNLAPEQVRRFFSGWRFAAVLAWLFFALVGAGNLLLRESAAPVFSSNYLAVGPALALHAGQAAGTSGSTPGIVPARLRISSIGVDAPVEAVGLTDSGAMQTPSSFMSVAWYQGGSKPGAPGNAVIDGHVNNALTSAGVFEHLDQLRLGDRIRVSDSSGKTLAFTVISEQLYGADHAPTGQIFAAKGPPELVLITCDGAWDQGKKEFDKRLVIYAALASSAVLRTP